MKQLVTNAVVAGIIAAGTVAAPAAAQTATTSPAIAGIGVASLDGVIANSNAFRTAQQQRATTYKPQIDQAQARKNAIEAQLKPLVDKFNADRAAAVPNQASLAQQAQAIQGIQQAGEQELQRIMAPVSASQAYVTEQIEDKLDAAVKAAMTKNKISLVLNPQAIIAANSNAYNLNQAILTELNTAIPSAQLVPPAGWVPREVREQQAQQAAQSGAAPAASNRPQPQGR